MTTVYGRLNPYLAGMQSQIVNFDKDITDTLNIVPPLLVTWQQEDVGANTVQGYFKNSLANVCNSIISSANSIVQDANGVSSLTAMKAAAIILESSAKEFLAHTYRISGVVEPTPETATKPHYSTAVSMGKSLVTVTYQTDTVSNNSPILAFFTSLFTGNTLNTASITLATDAATVNASISYSGFPTPSKTTSLTPGQITAITANIISTTSSMDTPRINDENYFRNSALVLQDFSAVRYFSSVGESEKYLIKNFVGSDKIKQRVDF